MGTRNLANLYDGVLIASSIGLKDGKMLMTGLCTLPYKICKGVHLKMVQRSES